jgi:hypothetical protein
MDAMRLAACALTFAISACSPWSGGAAFHCETDAQCTGGSGAGRCEMLTGFCSFEDGECTSGQRYGSSSGSLSDVCVGDEPPIDAPLDIAVDTPDGYVADARQCFGTPINICLTAVPMSPMNLPGTINTDGGCTQVVTQANGPDLCIVAATTITVGGATHASGNRALVLVATETIDVQNVLDASSAAGAPGAAANFPACTVAQAGGDDTGGGAGGAGGGFQAKGGDGGRGDENNSGAPAGKANGGTAGASQTTAIIRGGCKGGDGGLAGGTRTAGAHGGGAVYLIAGSSITVGTTGGVYAAGGGGLLGDNCNGASGGGSGGMIGFDAPTITITGKVAANGGGGGGGGGSGTAGSAGGNGTTTSYNTRAAAGASGANNGPGGSGVGGLGSALGNTTGANGSNGDCGGGGGGGGVGLVWTHGAVTGNQISPAATPK